MIALEIEGYPNYWVTTAGEVWSFKGKCLKVLRVSLDSKGYPRVTLCDGGLRTIVLTHKLVAQSFLTKSGDQNQVNHIDGCKYNNKVANLEWCSQAENNQHAYDTGLKVAAKGENCAQSKLTEDIVRAIRVSKLPGNTLGRFYGVSASYISAIRLRRKWRHI